MTEYFPVFQSLLTFTSPLHVSHTQKGLYIITDIIQTTSTWFQQNTSPEPWSLLCNVYQWVNQMKHDADQYE